MSAHLPFRERPRSADGDDLAYRRPPPNPAQEEPFQPYEYQPLDEKAQEIRLLRLLPAENLDDEIEIEIFHAPLIEPERAPDTRLEFEELEKTLPQDWELHKTRDGRYLFYSKDSGKTQWTHPNPEIDQEMYDCDAVLDPFPNFQPAYEALSYCWENDQTATKARVIPVTTGKITTLDLRPNLAVALKHLRQATSPRVLWIDAICIDQVKVFERNHEVKRMGNIYKLARRVVVWLGPASESSPRGLEMLAALGEGMIQTSARILNAPLSDKKNYSGSLPGDVQKRFEYFSISQRAPYNVEDYQAISGILSQSWWDRLWIWQEIHLASSRSLVQCGSSFRLWKDIRSAIVFLDNSEQDELGTTLADLVQRKSTLTSRSSGYLVHILEMTRFAKYANPHDRVFALLGLASPKNAALIDTDYSQPVFETFQNVCSAHLQLFGSVEFLSHCDWSTHGQNPGHPSWTPNWSTWCPVNVFYFQAAAGLSRSRMDGLDGSRLTVDGVLCGVVDKVSIEASSQGQLRETLRIWEELVAKNDPERTEKLIETLSCGENNETLPWDQYPSIEQYRKAYYSNDQEPIVSDRVRGRSVFTYGNGGMGICCPGAKAGDLLVVILGCDSPLILRRHSSDNEQSTYVVIGPAFVSSLNYSGALLGPLPRPLEAFYTLDWEGDGIAGFRDLKNNTVVYDDPRLGPLPDEWAYRKDYRPDQKEWRSFWNKKTGEVTYFDPRLTPEELRKRGVKLEEYVLV